MAIRLDAHDHIAVCAPHGLDGIWRPNPTRVSPENSRQRLARHRPTQRWPRVRVITGQPRSTQATPCHPGSTRRPLDWALAPS
ncbi:nucleotidyltransferase family protein [Micromonospora gifhornensis]|uniref:nucleotidyltransferase family protein n=2 Tax=Micromonospora gifhornensis TaxID=84594 RepID=UPI001EF34ED9|nr:nucleotidyltransferase family protein [Micromonospora gifhornensis]